ncbi:hypothetical protein [Chryseobacterium sp.]|uniref:hypothetical protein n=1 Tax=Chryseobacterium sp. TaxID=1871047 RepID=UPI0024E236FA|nr:hypothetical protein [Chryseobacterium sp.]
MVKQYPYKLEVFVKTDAVKDDDGNWIPGSEEWQDFGKCRDEDSRSGTKTISNDQIKYEYTWLIQCPKKLKSIDIGSEVRVIGINGEIRLSGEVLRVKYDQLHSRIWV